MNFGTLELKLIDVSGREILVESNVSADKIIQLNVESIETGAYILSIFSNGSTMYCKPILITH
jgi:hypothetical protein